MRKVADYHVIVENSSALIAVEVRFAIKNGYIPQGGIACYTEETMSGPRARFAQAMVKYEEQDQ